MGELTRTISKSLAGILESLELKNKELITLKDLESLALNNHVLTAPSLIASRLKQSGWLLPTSQRGVWEFVPASRAGVYSNNDPLREIKAFRLVNPDTNCYLCLQTAAWALGLSDRIPALKELAFSTLPKTHIPKGILTYRYEPVLDPVEARGTLALAPASIFVHIASRPEHIRSWESVIEWLPDIVYEMDVDSLITEIKDRTSSVKQRAGFLLQGMYPEAAEVIYSAWKPTSKIRFGPRTSSIRNDEKWMISDTILPFSVKELEKVK